MICAAGLGRRGNGVNGGKQSRVYQRKIRRADQLDAIVAFSILRVDDEGTVALTSE